MKRYMLFMGDSYYPKGGMMDFTDSFDSIIETVELINSIMERKSPSFNLWVHIYDSLEGKIVNLTNIRSKSELFEYDDFKIEKTENEWFYTGANRSD